MFFFLVFLFRGSARPRPAHVRRPARHQRVRHAVRPAGVVRAQARQDARPAPPAAHLQQVEGPAVDGFLVPVVPEHHHRGRLRRLRVEIVVPPHQQNIT